MFVCCECFVLSGRGLCDELITRPEESYRPWCVVVCDLENLKNEGAMTRVGSQPQKKKMSPLTSVFRNCHANQYVGKSYRNNQQDATV
jgi:hypothetical protein